MNNKNMNNKIILMISFNQILNISQKSFQPNF